MRRDKMGFTLIELLMVLVIIAILAGGMGLYLITSSDTASATILISDLRSAKMAGFIWFVDNIESSDLDLANEWNGVNMSTTLSEYMNNDKILSFEFKYISGVGYLVGEPDVSIGIINKALRQTAGLGRTAAILLDDNGDPLDESGGSAAVFVLVRK